MLEHLDRAINWLRDAADPNDEGDAIGVALAEALEVWVQQQAIVGPQWLDAMLNDLKETS